MTSQPAVYSSRHFRQTLEEAASRASSAALSMQKDGYQKFSKAGTYSPEEMFTSADIEAQRIIVELLQASYSDIPVVAEEQQSPEITTDTFFTVDPIDGTLSYSAGGSSWGCIVGYIHKGQPAAGALSSPVHGTVSGALTKGCYLNGSEVKLHDAPLTSVVIPYGPWTPHVVKDRVLPALERDGIEVIRTESTADAFFRLLMGQAQLQIGCAERIWDIAGPAALITEAGGVVCSSDGSDHSWSKIEAPSLMAVSRRHIDRVLTQLRD